MRWRWSCRKLFSLDITMSQRSSISSSARHSSWKRWRSSTAKRCSTRSAKLFPVVSEFSPVNISLVTAAAAAAVVAEVLPELVLRRTSPKRAAGARGTSAGLGVLQTVKSTDDTGPSAGLSLAPGVVPEPEPSVVLRGVLIASCCAAPAAAVVMVVSRLVDSGFIASDVDSDVNR
ncbi:hypothetical protein LSCM1_06858 [Leishmania martiniquensis]|uniref:Uncharacterized protein n=1 Tax=Leishmania martiniquensis TaxID=1580590 RepID=A0A836KRF3_9TRYP|nr:hypothetical protein LSCM1_06858 [Leishmania martiniquensis]